MRRNERGKLLLMLIVLILLGLVCYRLLRGITGLLTSIPEDGGIVPWEEEPEPEDTPEPVPTMPAWIGEDSFYDHAGITGSDP